MKIEIRLLKGLAESQSASACIARAVANLAERGLWRYSWTWNSKAIAAFDGERCVGVLCYSVEEGDGSLDVGVTGVDPGNEQVFVTMLMRLRDVARESGVKRVTWGCHANNAQMQKACRALKADPETTNWSLPVSRFPAKAKAE